MEEVKAIASAENLDLRNDRCAVSLVFAAGTRPRASAIGALAASSDKFAVSHDPHKVNEVEEGWVELIANGLTFDLTGLNPEPAQARPECAHLFGLTANADLSAGEPITIMPGPHLASARTMFPVLRTLAWLGALLAELPQVRAVVWHPARSWSDPHYFRASVLRWIEGGAFPGLGLTAIAPTADGGLTSEGLAIFTGQELVLAPELARDRAEGAKIALRLINWLAESGGVTESTSVMGPSGETLNLVPDREKQNVKVTASS